MKRNLRPAGKAKKEGPTQPSGQSRPATGRSKCATQAWVWWIVGLAVVALVAYARTGDVVSAEVHYRRALEIASDYPEVHNNLAHLLVHPGRFEKAERHFREAIRLLPDFGTAHNGLGCFSSDKGGLPRLVRISSEPSNTIPLTGAWFNLGQSRAKGQEWEAAAVALRRVLQLQPGFKPVHELSTVRDLRVKVFG